MVAVLKMSEIAQSKEPLVIMMIGASGSGKSTLAHELTTFRDDMIVVSSDDTRELLTGDPGNMPISRLAFEHIHTILETRSRHGVSTVFDATSLKRADRMAIMASARKSDRHFKVVGVLVETPLETCKARQHMRDRQVPEYVIEKHHNSYQASKKNVLEERFDALFIYDTEEKTLTELETFTPPEPSLDIANIVTAFNKKTIGSKVTDPIPFLATLSKALKATDFGNQRVKGQAYIPLNEAVPYVSCGVGIGTGDPSDYVIREHRGNMGLYLKREHAAPTKNLAVVVYTRDAYMADPDVQENTEEFQRATDSDSTHFLVAVLASAGDHSPHTPGRFVRNLAGGNHEAMFWTASEIRKKAQEIVSYYDEENWKVVAD